MWVMKRAEGYVGYYLAKLRLYCAL